MASGNASVELAPLKGSFELNLDSITEAQEAVEDFAETLEGLGGSIEFSSNIDSLIEQLSDLTSNLSDFNESIDFTSNISDITEQVEDLKASLSSGFNLEINSNISGFNEKLEDLSQSLEITQSLTQEEIEILQSFGATMNEIQERLGDLVNSSNQASEDTEESFSAIEEKAEDLKEKVNTLEETFEALKSTVKVDGYIEINGLFNTIDSLDNLQEESANLIKELQDLEESSVDTDDSFESFTDRVKETSNSIFDLQNTLRNISDNMDNLSEACKGDESALSSLGEEILQVDMKLRELKELSDIQGNIDIEGLRQTLEELEALQIELSETSAKAMELNSAGELDDNGLMSLQEAASDTTLRIGDLQDQVGDTINTFKEEQAPIRNSGEGLREFGSKALESGQNALWMGMMVKSLFQPLDSFGELSIKSALQSSTAMDESNRAFGKSATQVKEWAENSVNSMGISSGAAMHSAETFALATKNMGANKAQSSKLGEEYTQLAAHIMLASNGTVNFQTASQDVMAIMQGNTYACKRLGLSFSKASLNAEALQLGYHKTFSQLTPLEQSTVRMKLAQKGLNDTYGSTGHLLTTNSGKWQKTKAQLEETAETVGTSLLPAFEEACKEVTKLASWFDHLNSRDKDLVIGFGIFLAALGPLIETIAMTTIAIGGLSEAFGALELVFSPVTLAIAAVGLAIFGLYEAWKHNFLGIRTDTTRVWHEVIKVFEWGKHNIGTILKDVLKTILLTINPAIEIVHALREAWAHNFLGIRSDTLNTWHAIKTVISDGLKDIDDSFHEFWNTVKAIADDIGETVEKATRDTFNDVKNVVEDIYHTIIDNPIVNAIGQILHSIYDLVETILSSIKQIAEAFFHFIWSWVDHYMHEILNTIHSVLDNVWHVVENIYNTIKGITEGFFSWLIGVLQVPINAIIHMVESIKSHIESGISDAVNIFRNLWDGLCSWFDGAVLRPIERVVSAMERFAHNVENGVRNAYDAFRSEWDSLCSWFNGEVTKPVDAVTNTAGQWLSAGEQIITSLWHGIENVFGDMSNWVTGKISGLINDITSFTHTATTDLNNASYNGSHATGLDYVPWDGYRAELHKGEMVLTADQAESYKNGQGSVNGGGNTYNFYSPKALDPFEARQQIEILNRNLANGFS